VSVGVLAPHETRLSAIHPKKNPLHPLQFSSSISALEDEGEFKGNARSRFAVRCDGPIRLSWSRATILKQKEKGGNFHEKRFGAKCFRPLKHGLRRRPGIGSAGVLW
jgi:hypothetical protein